MIFCFLTLLLLDTDAAAWRINETGVYQPLRTDEVIVRPDGHVYVLNFNDAKIGHYDATGKYVGTIGSKGKGPGQFTYPMQFFYDQGRLYVSDIINSSVSVFEQDGKFVERVRIPQRGITLARIPNGWIYGTWGDNSNPGQAASVMAAGDRFEDPVALFQLKENGYGGGLNIEEENGKVMAVFTPLSDAPNMVANADGSRVYVSEPGIFHVRVIDTKARTVIAEIKHPSKRIPFDAEWGLAERERVETMIPPEDRGIKFKNNFPQFFPSIRAMLVAPEGHLVVNRWAGRPDIRSHPLVLDDKGNDQKTNWSWETLERIARIAENFAYVIYFDEKSEQGALARVPVKNVAAFIDAHPVNYEGPRGRRIMMEN